MDADDTISSLIQI